MSDFDDGEEFFLMAEQTGMISNFSSSDTKDPLVQYLMLSDSDRKDATVPLEELRKKAGRHYYAKDAFKTFQFNPNAAVICKNQADLLRQFLHYVWDRETEESNVDMKAVIDFPDLRLLLSQLDAEVDRQFKASSVVANLKILFFKVPGARGDPKIVFRMTEGPTNACIAFHHDGGYASSTSQIALNDPKEYTGGSLCFFVNDHLHILTRPVGSLVQHAPEILHGVTQLTQGTRMSMFVVDESNGHYDTDIIGLESHHVKEFLDYSNPQLPLCTVCMVQKANHNIFPCGCVCFCDGCSRRQRLRKCPRCHRSIQGVSRINF